MANGAGASFSRQSGPGFQERRTHARNQPQSIIYVELGAGNGGVITNLSEGGLEVQAAIALVEDSCPELSFSLGQPRARVAASGKIIWKSASRKTAGVQFVELPEQTRSLIREWLALGREDANAARSAGGAGVRRAQDRPQQGIRPGDSLVDMHPSPKPMADGQPALEAARIPEEPMGRPNGNDLDTDTPDTKAEHIKRRLKRYLVSERQRIRLHDLVSQETVKLCDALARAGAVSPAMVTEQEFRRRVQFYESQAAAVVTIMATGCFWGEQEHASIWAKVLERVATAAGRPGGRLSNSIDCYPALLLLYAGGLAAVASGEYATLAPVLYETRLASFEQAGMASRFPAQALVDDKVAAEILYGGNRGVGLSERLHAYLREPLRGLVSFATEYDELFDRFEYLLALIWTDEDPQSISLDWIAQDVPLGLFAPKTAGLAQSQAGIAETVAAEISQYGHDWPPLRGGLFAGSIQRLQSSKKRVDGFVATLQSNRGAAKPERIQPDLPFSQ